MTRRRNFNQAERAVLFLLSGGKCQECGHPLGRYWHADHIKPYSKGGLTIISNGRALCSSCNLKKGAKEQMKNWNRTLRRWQQNAYAAITTSFDIAMARGEQGRFTLVAFPGSGKTTLALRVAHDWLSGQRGRKRIVIVVVPSLFLKEQFSNDADELGLIISPNFRNRFDELTAGTHGIVVTYQQLASDSAKFDTICLAFEALVIMDECHHLAGENLEGETKPWGDAALTAFLNATAVLMMTGTPWRSDRHAIPFVEYDENNEFKVEPPNGYNYGYKDALADTMQAAEAKDVTQKVCRELIFVNAGGRAEFFYKTDNIVTELNEDLAQEHVSPALRTALNPEVGEWFRNWFSQADKYLLAIRNDPEYPFPIASGLVIAHKIERVEQYAKIIEQITGEKPCVVTYKEDDPMAIIDSFKFRADKNGNPIRVPRWIVSINMISEGTDIPQLIVLFYATVVKRQLYFYQALGRVIRWDRKAESPERQRGVVYMPYVNPLIGYAEKIKEQIVHILKEHKPGPPPPVQDALFVPRSNDSLAGPLISTAEDERIGVDYVRKAQAEIGRNHNLAGLPSALGALFLKGLHKHGEVNFETDTPKENPQPPSSSRVTTEQGWRKTADQVDTLIREAARRFYPMLYQMDANKPAIFMAFYSYIANDMDNLGYGKKNEWGENSEKVYNGVLKWLKEGYTPSGLDNKVDYFVNHQTKRK